MGALIAARNICGDFEEKVESRPDEVT